MAIHLVGAIEVGNRLQAITVEMALHEHFKRRRTIGEWFTLVSHEQQALEILLHQWPVDDPVMFLERAAAECKELVRQRSGVVSLDASTEVASTA